MDGIPIINEGFIINYRNLERYIHNQQNKIQFKTYSFIYIEMNQISKYYIYYGLNFILAFLSYIIPKNNKQVLIGSRLFIGNPKHFYLYLCKNKKLECKVLWITMNREIFSRLKNEGLPVIYLYSMKGFLAILRSRYLLFSHDVRTVSYFLWLPGRFNKVQLWHGIATKVFGKPPSISKNSPISKKLVLKLLVRDRKSFHTIITCSDKSKKRDMGLFQNKNVKILGFPRNDIFFNKYGIFDDLYTKYHLNKYDKIILYCPTWREDADDKSFGTKIPFSSDFLKELNNFLKNKNFIMLIKKHTSEIGKRLDIPDFSNIRNIPKEIDIQEMLIHSDIIITDYSSVFRDFCLTGKPMIFYLFDYEEYTKNKGSMYTDYFNEIPGLLAMNEKDLLNYLMNVDTVTSDAKYKEKYECLVNVNHFYQDGKSSERLYNYLLKEF